MKYPLNSRLKIEMMRLSLCEIMDDYRDSKHEIPTFDDSLGKLSHAIYQTFFLINQYIGDDGND